LSELPFVPYEGPEPYIFVSYAHKNKDKVYPIIKRLHEMGYRLWYDEGIQPGKEWGDEVQRHLESATMMLLFLSPMAVERPNVRSEIQFAWSKMISILSVDLEETKELKHGLGLWLGICQRVLFYSYTDVAAFCEKLKKGMPKETCKSIETSKSIEGLQVNGKLYGWRECMRVRADEVLLYAAAVAIAMGDPLQDIFESVLEGDYTVLPEVSDLVYENRMGLSCQIHNQSVLFGNRMLLESHGVIVDLTERDERTYEHDGRRILYFAVEKRLVAFFVVSYNSNAVPKFLRI